MKNKIISFVITISLLITIIPSSVNALSIISPNSNEKVANTSKKIKNSENLLKVKKPTSKEIKKAGSEEEYYRQLLTEEIDALYYETKEKSYISSIQTVIDSTYKDAIKQINETDELISNSELASININKLYYKLSILSGWTDSIVVNNNYYNTLKKAGTIAVNDAYNCVDSIDFNAYYYNIITGYYNTYLNYINSATDFNSLANAFSNIYISTIYDYVDIFDITFIISYDGYEDTSIYDQIYGFCNYFISFPDEEYIEFLDSIDMSYVPSVYKGSTTYTNEEIESTKNGLIYYIDTYLYKQLPNSEYDITQELENLVINTENEIEKAYNPDVMYNKYIRLINTLESKTNIYYQEISTTTINKLYAGLNKLNKKYTDRNIYSNNYASKNANIIQQAQNTIDYTIYEAEIPSDFLTRVEKVLKKTPTKKVELANAKKTYTKKLNLFINNKKYNQKLVVPIVKEGNTKINKATSITGVKSIYNTYYKKALTTINKYKITTSKSGKGTITKSKTYTYGSNVTIKMTPNKGYKISKVYVDNKRVKTTSKYTFKKINKAHSIKVVFVKK